MTTGRLDAIALAKTEREKEIVRALWREYYGLYNEKYAKDATWLRNTIAAEIEFALAIGQDNQLHGEDSKAIGTGAITRAFRELALGSYGLDTPANSATEWNPLDLLMVLMNGADADNRSNAIEVFKSGLVKLFNAIKLAKYEHGEEIPEDWTISLEDEGLSYWKDDKWNRVTPIEIVEEPIGSITGENTIFSTSVPYISGTLKVFVNGLKEKFFTENTDTEFALSQAPKNVGFTDTIEVIYLKK